MQRHHHGYTWLGSGFDLHQDGPRRAVHPAFVTNPLPPLEVAHWLLKPASLVRGTFAEPHEAAEWFAAQVRPHIASFATQPDAHPVDDRIPAIAEQVADGADTVGGWWLTGQRFLSVSLVACSPHRLRPTYPCPVADTS
ncbi:hypothetical protein ACH4E8_04145 [Streptomyces sp. NPDC017979]|uniref:hypothetical protein n=1 Tax=Streptomyces sp. NPDC017979 TaxID=3365024 RepID=UPI00379AA034